MEDQYAALVTFIPDFNQKLTLEDIFAELVFGKSYTPSEDTGTSLEMEKATGEFIFIIDRSGSMYGDRIDYLRNTLKELLMTLPPKSYYNIVSFGSNHEFYKNKSL